MRWPVLVVLLLLSESSSHRFEDYPLRGSPYHGTPSAPDLGSARFAHYYRTALRDGAALGPSFAGEWAVVIWGCGTGCQYGAMVNSRTGRVCWLPQEMSRRAEFRLDSRLLVLSPVRPGDDIGPYPAEDPFVWYFEWTGTQFRLVDSTWAVEAAGRTVTDSTPLPPDRPHTWQPCLWRASTPPPSLP